jgi:hypothetical protein
MSRAVQDSLRCLKLIAELPNSKNTTIVRALLNSGDKDLTKAVRECVKNVVYNSSLNLTPVQKRKLKQYKSQLIKLCAKNTSEKCRLGIVRKFGHLFAPTVIRICYKRFTEDGYESGEGIQAGASDNVQQTDE